MRLALAILFLGSTILACSQPSESSRCILGNEKLDVLIPILESKNVAVVGNHTSVIKADITENPTHLVDTLMSLGVNVVKAFAPEHGFRGNQANGANIVDGARFYTYLSTLLLVMEAAAENDIKVIVLDRPNPHGHHVQGPMLDPDFSSFVGLAPVPVVHGMTLGEIALMTNGEGWLKGGIVADLEVISCEGYKHSSWYSPTIAPSPNLPSEQSIALYPSLCFFEPTAVSIGRGTPTPFEITGYPGNTKGVSGFGCEEMPEV